MRATLNQLSQPANGLGTSTSAALPGIEPVLLDIAAKLSNIETLYAGLTGKLEKVDMRFEEVRNTQPAVCNGVPCAWVWTKFRSHPTAVTPSCSLVQSERHIRDLQHFSASTIHETARLVGDLPTGQGL